MRVVHFNQCFNVMTRTISVDLTDRKTAEQLCGPEWWKSVNLLAAHGAEGRWKD